MRGKARNQPHYTTHWDDLDPWVEQVYYEHGYQTRFIVYLHAETYGLKPGVALELTRPASKGRPEALVRDWDTFQPDVHGAVEGAALRLISKALLTLDNDKWRAERSQVPLWGNKD